VQKEKKDRKTRLPRFARNDERILDHHAKGDSNDGFRGTLDIIKQTQLIEALCCFSTT
jgi:hypothetical protein